MKLFVYIYVIRLIWGLLYPHCSYCTCAGLLAEAIQLNRRHGKKSKHPKEVKQLKYLNKHVKGDGVILDEGGSICLAHFWISWYFCMRPTWSRTSATRQKGCGQHRHCNNRRLGSRCLEKERQGSICFNVYCFLTSIHFWDESGLERKKALGQVTRMFLFKVETRTPLPSLDDQLSCALEAWKMVDVCGRSRHVCLDHYR